ncbi:hypothetical protein [Dickeya oryzae]
MEVVAVVPLNPNEGDSASKTVLRQATSPGERHGCCESLCRAGQKTLGTFLNSVYAGPQGEPPWMGRVIASQAARTAKANAEGTALAARFSHQPVVKEGWRLHLSLSCEQ